ncbi:cupin domain-containing protein [Comamonadaceae bacterium G21597-S1]|nr:cupin domain-containing protein [Comamonadaceae bacterium G21597-S1]
MAQPHARSAEVVNLMPLAHRLAGARTTAVLKARQLEVVRLVLHRGKTLPEHQVPGEITVLCLEGRLSFRSTDGTVELGPMDFIHLHGGVPHALTALEDASALLTICLADRD